MIFEIYRGEVANLYRIVSTKEEASNQINPLLRVLRGKYNNNNSFFGNITHDVICSEQACPADDSKYIARISINNPNSLEREVNQSRRALHSSIINFAKQNDAEIRDLQLRVKTPEPPAAASKYALRGLK